MHNTQEIHYVSPDHKELSYCGRIDYSDPQSPCFIYAGSSVILRFKGTSVKVKIKNLHHYNDSYFGYVLDGAEYKIKLDNKAEDNVYSLADALSDDEHTLILYKRKDAAHYFYFLGFLLDQDSIILPALPKPTRRMECYGDSVSAGEVCEALDFIGQPDPPHNGEYSNSWYSYASITARNLGAELHSITQGGIALFDDTGYFLGPNYIGLETTYDKLSYNKYILDYSPWDFSLYTPHVVLIAIGQNDSHPNDYMGIDVEKSSLWKSHYKKLVQNIRGHYPNALIILKTTILNHRIAWDEAIEEVTLVLNDPKIVHFTYSNNACGTPGHIRIPEAKLMAEELTSFINTFGNAIWYDTELS